MERSLNRPSYVLAIVLGVIATIDSGSALLAMQTPGVCSGLNLSGVGCGSNAGWVIDLAAAGISAGLVAFLLMRPHLYVFGATVGWAAVAFVSNFALRHVGTIDVPATYRMTGYFLVLVIAGVLFAVEGKPKWDAERAKVPVAQMPPGWPAGYPAPPPPYFVPPVAPVAPAAPGPVEPAEPAKK
jgi:hypothetical protein